MSGVKGAALPRRSDTLDAGGLYYAHGTGAGVCQPRLPHGECGVWGSAPRLPSPQNNRIKFKKSLLE